MNKCVSQNPVVAAPRGGRVPARRRLGTCSRVISVTIILVAGGCAPRSVTVSVHPAHSDKANLAIRTAPFHLLGNNEHELRYLVFEVEPAASSGKPARADDGAAIFPDMTSVISKGSAGPVVNLVVVELEGLKHRSIFAHPVAIERWDLSVQERHGRVLSFPDLLVILARTRDDNGDAKIDYDDSLRAFSYSLASDSLKPLSPEGFHVTQATRSGDRLILALVQQQERHASRGGIQGVSVFASTPGRLDDGHWVVQNMMP